MLIYMLAIAMTIVMLIATIFGVLQEAETAKLDVKQRHVGDFRAFGRG